MKVWWVNYVGQHPQSRGGGLVHGGSIIESKTDWFPIVSAGNQISEKFQVGNIVIQSWQKLSEEQIKEFSGPVKGGQ